VEDDGDGDGDGLVVSVGWLVPVQADSANAAITAMSAPARGVEFMCCSSVSLLA
jgi:hypothetical protein